MSNKKLQVAGNISKKYDPATFPTMCSCMYGQATEKPDMCQQHYSNSVAQEFAGTHGNMADSEVLVSAAYLVILNIRKINRRTWI